MPSRHTAEYEFVKKVHPDLWGRWEDLLRRWARRIGLDGETAEAWVTRGLWRWLTPAAQKMRLAQRLGLKLPDWKAIYRRWLAPRLEAFEEGDRGYRIILSELGFDPNWALDQYTVLGAFEPRGNGGAEEVILEAARGRVRVRVSRRSIEVEGARGVLGRELALDALKLAFRWSNCAGCRACETSCPTGAIRVVGEGGSYRPRVDASRCIHCKLCLDNCPLADVVVEKVYAALALGTPLAWRREGRRKHESVVERYLKLKGYEKPEGRAAEVTVDSLVEPAALEGEEA
jgi:phosphoadenosine phosphosulfate reductase